MSYSLMPSLQSMTAMKIATVLWNQWFGRAPTVKLEQYQFASSINAEHWKGIRENVIDKVSLLPLPPPLKEEILNFLTRIVDQMRKWEVMHFSFGFKNFPKKFYWLSQGTLDKKMTAEVFVRDLTLPEWERHSMACLYCIETHWDSPVPLHPTASTALNAFVAYWAYNITGDETALETIIGRDASKTPYQHALECAVKCGNPAATDYYFHKLSPKEKEESLSDVELGYYYHSDFDVIRFLLLHMNEGQQSRLFDKYTVHVLESLLVFPWHDLFMTMANRLRDVLDADHYCELLKSIICRIEDGYEDDSYEELFGKLWEQIPVLHKEAISHDWTYHSVLHRLFEVRDVKNILLFLKDLTKEEKEGRIFCDKEICACLADDGEWDMLELFIGQCISSRKAMIEFKEECKESARYFSKSFFPFMDALIEKCGGKRSAEEADCPVSKKLRTSSNE